MNKGQGVGKIIPMSNDWKSANPREDAISLRYITKITNIFFTHIERWEIRYHHLDIANQQTNMDIGKERKKEKQEKKKKMVYTK